MKYQKQLLGAALVATSLFAVTSNASVAYTNTRPATVVYTGKKLFSGPYITAGTGLSQQKYHSTGAGENSVIKSHV
ncbi:MAG: hypothetical protein AB7F64_09620, partial [Gammaproteobacteria bacterium]